MKKKVLYGAFAVILGFLCWKVYYYTNAVVITNQRAVAVDLVKELRGDLSPQLTNAEALDESLRKTRPASIYGWGGYELDGSRYTVDFIYRGETTVMYVWIVNIADGSVKNVTYEKETVTELKTKQKLNLPYYEELMPYDIEYTMSSFRNSDYYRGRGYGPKEELNRRSVKKTVAKMQRDNASTMPEPAKWQNHNGTQKVFVFRIDGPASEQRVRDQSAGVLDSIVEDGLLLIPTSCRAITINKLPGWRLDGISHGKIGQHNYSIITAFAADRSYLIHCVSPLGETIENLESKIAVNGEVFQPATAILNEIVPKIEMGLPELARLIEDTIRKQNLLETGKN